VIAKYNTKSCLTDWKYTYKDWENVAPLEFIDILKDKNND